jgi:uncharacterized protein (TIGR03437 family)
VVSCQHSLFIPGLQIAVAGQVYSFQMDLSDQRSQIWNVPASLAAGVYQARLLPGAFAPISFTLIVDQPAITQMTSLRSVVKPQFAPGEVVTLYGYGLTGVINNAPTADNSSPGVPLANQLAQSQVLVDGAPVPLYFAFTSNDGGSQINLQLPYSLTPGSHKVRVNRLLANGSLYASTADFSFVISPISPTYSGSDTAPLFVQNFTQGPEGNVFVTGVTPLRGGDVVVVYATGLGATKPALKEGTAPPAGVLANVLTPVVVLLRSASSQWTADLLGAVASPVYPGLYQIAFRVPADTDSEGSPTIDLVLGVGGDVQVFTLNVIR